MFAPEFISSSATPITGYGSQFKMIYIQKQLTCAAEVHFLPVSFPLLPIFLFLSED